jgi:fibronectin type 3 domain-containing protein
MEHPFPIQGCFLLALLLLAGCGVVSPVNVAGNQAANHYVTLSWNASNGATHYRIYRSSIAGGYYGLVGSTADLTFTDQNVNSGATYYYVCTALDSAGTESGYSNEAGVTIP